MSSGQSLARGLKGVSLKGTSSAMTCQVDALNPASTASPWPRNDSHSVITLLWGPVQAQLFYP